MTITKEELLEFLSLNKEEALENFSLSDYSNSQEVLDFILSEPELSEKLQALTDKFVSDMTICFAEDIYLKHEFLNSLVFTHFLTPEDRGYAFVLFLAEQNFPQLYEVSQKPYLLNDVAKEKLTNAFLHECSRIYRNHDHLKEETSYAFWLKENFKDNLDSERFYFLMYINFILCTKSLSTFLFRKGLEDIGLEDNVQNNSLYIEKTNSLLKDFKEILHFDDWNQYMINFYSSKIHANDSLNYSHRFTAWDTLLKDFIDSGFTQNFEALEMKHHLDNNLVINQKENSFKIKV